jgi:hypothetical protein
MLRRTARLSQYALAQEECGAEGLRREARALKA